MSFVVTFADYSPPVRTDNKPWAQVRIEEASASTGPWTALSTLALSPLDSDPSHPQERDFTIENATLALGWYRVVFVDVDGDESLPSLPLQNVVTVADEIRPTVDDVAAFIPGRVSGSTFTTSSRPSSAQVDRLIALAVGDVLGRVNGIVPTALLDQARWLVTVNAARHVEIGFFPEQQDGTPSVSDSLTAVFDAAITDFVTNCRLPMRTTLA